jgi:hypothetical protein
MFSMRSQELLGSLDGKVVYARDSGRNTSCLESRSVLLLHNLRRGVLFCTRQASSLSGYSGDISARRSSVRGTGIEVRLIRGLPDARVVIETCKNMARREARVERSLR